MRRIFDRIVLFFSSLLGIWKLDVYGESLADTNVKRILSAGGIALSVQFSVDTFVWSSTAYYGLQSLFLALGFGLAMATMIALFDRALMTMDMSQSRAFWTSIIGRGAIIIVLGLITAVPFELAIFQPDIDQVLTSQDAGLRSILIDNGQKSEDNLAKEKIAKIESDRGIALAEVDKDRTPGRAALVGTFAVQLGANDAAIKEARQRVADEASGLSGRGLSGKIGAGSATKAAQAQVADANAEQKNFQDRMTTELTAFDAETQKEKNDILAEARKKTDKVLDDKAAALAAVRTASSEELAQKYGGAAAVSRGFLKRYETLEDLAAKIDSVRVVIWGCRLVMMIVALLVMGMKLMAGGSLKTYFSVWAQALAGHPGAIRQIEANGYLNKEVRGNMAIPVSVRDAILELEKMRRELCGKLAVFHQTVSKKCLESSSRPQHGRNTWLAAGIQGQELNAGDGPLTQNRIEFEIRKVWAAEVQEALAEVREQEDQIRAGGFMPPPWSANLPFTEPNGLEPWRIPLAKLRELGWVEPTTDVVPANDIPEEPPPGVDPDVWRAARKATHQIHHGDHLEPPPPVETEEGTDKVTTRGGGIFSRFRRGFNSLVERGRAAVARRRRS